MKKTLLATTMMAFAVGTAALAALPVALALLVRR